MQAKFCRIVVPFYVCKEIKKMEKNENKALDAIDIKILVELQRNGKISVLSICREKSGAFANALFCCRFTFGSTRVCLWCIAHSCKS